METPLITIVHNKNDGFCKLLLLYNQHQYYYSENKTHKDLRYFMKSRLIEIHNDNIVLHSKNNKKILIITV